MFLPPPVCSSPPPPCGAEVVVEFDYDALHDDELTLRLGDVIKNVRYVEEDGWMEGDLNGKRGLFPDNFVKVRVALARANFRITLLVIPVNWLVSHYSRVACFPVRS